MGLESATFLADLVSTNPLGSDAKNQGDDHIRLVKAVLQATFPGANRAFTLTKSAELSDTIATEAASRALVTADLGKVLLGDPTGGNRTLTLPDPSAVGTGWGVIIKRKTGGTNSLTIARFAAETIDGVARDITLDIINDTVVIKTDGTNWFVVGSHLYGESRLITGGAADVYTVALGRNAASYYDGLTVRCEIHAANTGAATLNADGIGADAIVWPNGTALAAGDLPLGAKVILTHDGTNWQLMTVAIPPVIKNADGGITLTDTDAGAGEGPVLELYRNSGTPAASDLIGVLRFRGEDDADLKVTYADIIGRIIDPAAASLDGAIRLRTQVAGVLADRMVVEQGVILGSPTGDDKGGGTLNVENGFFDNNLRLRNGLILLDSQSPVAASTIDIISAIAAPFRAFLLTFDLIPSVDDVQARLRTSTDNGGTFDSGAGHYQYAGQVVGGGSSAQDLNSASATFIALSRPAGGSAGVGNASDEGISGHVWIFDPLKAATKTRVSFETSGLDAAGGILDAQGSGLRASAADVDAVQLSVSSGNLTGETRLYGLQDT